MEEVIEGKLEELEDEAARHAADILEAVEEELRKRGVRAEVRMSDMPVIYETPVARYEYYMARVEGVDGLVIKLPVYDLIRYDDETYELRLYSVESVLKRLDEELRETTYA